MWRGGKREGTGAHRFADGSHYCGEYSVDKFEGHGQTRGHDGKQFEGQFAASQFNGFGVEKQSSGATYEGQWANGQRDGFGVFLEADGSCYEGQWRNGSGEGRGEFWGPASSVRYGGLWHKDKQDLVDASVEAAHAREAAQTARRHAGEAQRVASAALARLGDDFNDGEVGEETH